MSRRRGACWVSDISPRCSSGGRGVLRIVNLVLSVGKIRDRIAGYGDALVRLGYAWDGFSNIAGDETKVDREKEVIKCARTQRQ